MRQSLLVLLFSFSSALSLAINDPNSLAARGENPPPAECPVTNPAPSPAANPPTGPGIGAFINCEFGGGQCPGAPDPAGVPSSSSSTTSSTSSTISSFTSSTSSSTDVPQFTSTPVPGAGQGPTKQTMSLKRDWRIDAAKLENLRAEKKCKMMYTNSDVEIGTEPSSKTPVAWVTMPEMKYPAIQLYNTDKVSKVQCQGDKRNPNKITMQFKDKEAYDYAWNNWHNEVRSKEGDYLVITDAPGCWEGPDAGQERSFLKATTEERDDETLSISCNIKAVPFSETVPEDGLNDIDFGEFQPGKPRQGPNRQGPLKDTSGDSDFDRNVDSQIPVISEQSLAETPLGQAGFTLDDFYGDSGLQDLVGEESNPNLAKRRLRDRIKKAFKKVGTAVKKAVTVVKDTVKQVAEKVVEVAKEVGKALNDFFTFDRSFSRNASFDTITKTNNAVTPFNGARGISLFKEDQEVEVGATSVTGSVELFCVECGFEGDFVIAGKLRFSIGQGMEKAELTLTGNMDAGFSLGLVGDLGISRSQNVTSRTFRPKKRKEVEKRLISQSIGDFVLPGILDIGPIASVDVGVDLSLAASGKLLAGVVFSWPNIDAKIDLKDSNQNKAEGFGPDVTPIFEADGEFTVEAGTFLAFKLAFGVSILNGKFDFTAGVQLKPRVAVSATVAVEADLNGVNLAETSAGCKGIGIGVGTTFEVAFVIFEGLPAEQTIPIKTIDGPGFDECIQLFSKRSLFRRQSIPSTIPAPPSTLGNTTLAEGLLTSMATPNNEFRLRWSPNGNTYAVEETKVPANVKGREWSGWFASDESGTLVYGDSHGRIFHGYVDTIQNLGVSRVRLHGANEVPESAWPVMFAATIPEGSNTTSVATQDPTMVMSDVEGNLYFPIICVYESGNVFPKLFMANSTSEGIQTLMSNDVDVLDNVSGERIRECGFMPWTNFRTGKDIGDIAAGIP